MNIHQLRCAVTVARLGSQTRAAEELYMSQPNLSKALKHLEQTCGFRIFTRTGPGMAPTRRGLLVLGLASPFPRGAAPWGPRPPSFRI